MVQMISTAGSLLVLGAYVALQTKRLRSTSPLYTLLNLIGSALVAAVAITAGQWGILVLEGGWTLISLWAAVKILTGRPTHTAEHG